MTFSVSYPYPIELVYRILTTETTARITKLFFRFLDEVERKGSVLIIERKGSVLIIERKGSVLIIERKGSVLIIERKGSVLIIECSG